MSHQIILLTILSSAFLLAAIKLIKNRPQYLILLGIRGLLSCFFIQFINYVCSNANLSVLIAPNPLTIGVGSFLGFPGVLLLYLSSLYLA